MDEEIATMNYVNYKRLAKKHHDLKKAIHHQHRWERYASATHRWNIPTIPPASVAGDGNTRWIWKI